MSCTLMLLKFTHEATTLDYIEDDEGYAKKTKAAAPRRKTDVPRPRVMLQVFQFPRQNYTIAGRDWARTNDHFRECCAKGLEVRGVKGHLGTASPVGLSPSQREEFSSYLS